MILTELNRLASHMLWLGTHALDIGAITPLFYTFRDREEILKIFEKYCGARLTTHAFRIGGCPYETYEGFEREVKKFLDFVTPKIDEYEELLTTNRIWVERTKDVGKISAKECIALGVTGPVLRASGVKWDLRKAQPYAAYTDFDFEIPVGQNGDTYDRYIVRMQEMRQSLRIIEQAVGKIPDGPDHGQSCQSDEAARGRDLSLHRSAQGRAGILHRERRLHAALPGARAAAVFRQSAGAGHDGARRAGRRRHRRDRNSGHRSRRGGPLMLDYITSYFKSEHHARVCRQHVLGVRLYRPDLSGLSVAVIAMNWLERKILAHMQVRLGPMRVGPHGLLQPIADALKLLIKEDIMPAEADPLVFWVAPLIVVHYRLHRLYCCARSARPTPSPT